MKGDQEKADLIVINNMIKLICIADFSSHYFKEVSSLSKTVEHILNKDSTLDINAPKEEDHPQTMFYRKSKNQNKSKQTSEQPGRLLQEKVP